MTGKDVITRIEQLRQLRTPHEWLWDEIGFLTNARYFNRTQGTKTAGVIPHSEIYDTTLRTKSRMQANGITSMLFPRDRDWLTLKPPRVFKDNRQAKKVYREASEELMYRLRASNFHHQNHGVILHRSQLGTGTMRMETVEDDYGDKVFNFHRYEPVTYLIDHDSRSRVQTFACEYHWTAYQAAQEWGMNNLSAKRQRDAKDPNKRGETDIYHMLIERRPEWERKGGKGNKAMRYRVMVVEADGEHVVIDSGNDVFQIVASRYEVGDSPWGYSPSWEILPDAYKANFAAKFMMVMGERAAVPPVIAPASMKEEGIGLGAAEVTYVSDTNPNLWPKELSSSSNYAVGMDVWNQLRESIDEAFHGNLFNMFSRQQRDRTATEITAMQGEMNAQLDPTITALTQDHTEPIVQWAFHEMIENGQFDLDDEYRDPNTGKAMLPGFAYDNAISMNHERAKAIEAMGIIDAMANLQQLGIDVDVVKIKDTAMRIWRAHGQDEDELYSEDEQQQRAEEKAQAMAQAQQMEMAQQAASAAKDAKSAGLEPKEMMGRGGR